MSTKLLLGCSLLLLAGCATSALSPFLMDGKELHASLTTQKLTDAAMLQVPREGLRDIPYLSTDAEFVALIARGSSQGKLGPEGIRAALFAQYLGESWLGFYGLEAASTADADRREVALREIWAYGEGLGRARVHRKGKVLLVVWHGGVSPEIWEAVNAKLVERLQWESGGTFTGGGCIAAADCDSTSASRNMPDARFAARVEAKGAMEGLGWDHYTSRP